jgi:hypothetical protein
LNSLAVARLSSLALLGCAVVYARDLTGVWIVADEARRGFLSGAQQKGAAKITLATNGRSVATEIPQDLLYRPPAIADGVVRGSGHRALLRVTAANQYNLTLSRFQRVNAMRSITELNS